MKMTTSVLLCVVLVALMSEYTGAITHKTVKCNFRLDGPTCDLRQGNQNIIYAEIIPGTEANPGADCSYSVDTAQGTVGVTEECQGRFRVIGCAAMTTVTCDGTNGYMQCPVPNARRIVYVHQKQDAVKTCYPNNYGITGLNIWADGCSGEFLVCYNSKSAAMDELA